MTINYLLEKVVRNFSDRHLDNRRAQRRANALLLILVIVLAGVTYAAYINLVHHNAAPNPPTIIEE